MAAVMRDWIISFAIYVVAIALIGAIIVIHY